MEPDILEIVCPAYIEGSNSVVEAIPLLAVQGVTAVEIQLWRTNYFDSGNPNVLQKLIATLKTSGIRVHSIHAPFSAKCDISSPDDSIHENGVDGLIESIELAHLLEAEKVVVHTSDKIIPDEIKRRLNRAKGVLKEMSFLAAESSVTIAIENLPPGYLASNPKEFVKLIESIDKESVKGCFDTGHANLSGDFEDFAKQVLPYCVTTHIHDNNGDADTHLFPGNGSIDWKSFGNLYNNIESNASIMLECFPVDGMNWISAFQTFRATVGI